MSVLKRRTLLTAAWMAAISLCATPGRAEDPAAAGGGAGASGQDEPVLTVRALNGVMHSYRRSDLARMRRITFATTTIWTEGIHEFTGVPLSEILKDAGIEAGQIDLFAANDYVATLPVSDVDADVPIVADRLDGATMSLRDKGPLWVVYPYDADRRYQAETIFTRSVWQLVRIDAVPTAGD